MNDLLLIKLDRLEDKVKRLESNLWANIQALANRIVELESELAALREGK